MLGVDWGICTPLPGSATPQRLHRVSRKAEEKGQLAGPGHCEASRAHLSGHHTERGGYGEDVSGIFYRCLSWLWLGTLKRSFLIEPMKLAPPIHYLQAHPPRWLVP